MLCMTMLVLGCLSGLVMVKNKILGTLLVILSIFAMMGITVFMLLSADTNLMDFLVDSIWNDLPKVMVGILAAAFVGGELLIWRVIQRYVVR